MFHTIDSAGDSAAGDGQMIPVLRFVKERSELPVISVGGIMSAEEALRRLDTGADLVQIYTGFIYRGPALIREILRRISTESKSLEPPG